MSTQTHGVGVWREDTGAGATPSAAPIVLNAVSSHWEHKNPSIPDAIAVDPGDGSRTIFDLTREYFAVSDGAGGFVLSLTGPAVAVLVDDGHGGLTLTPVGTGVVQAGRFLPDSSGAVFPIRLAAADYRFAIIGDVIRPY